MTLSTIQQTIVDETGNLIVRASAGTGKTQTMVAKIAKEIERNRSHRVIAAVTFTIKAAQEIKDRLSVDVTRQFIGTNNSFAIEEVIKPFMKDVYGGKYDVNMSADYSEKIDTFQEGMERICSDGVLCSYKDNKKNFIFELAQLIVEGSKACRLYLQAKYFKIYIDEYQDCDKAMHKFFMYICDNLNIETFIVGDEKQSIYTWRGAYPEAFKGIWEKENFKKIFMGDNFRSCQQIQNYSNLLCEETRHLYTPVDNLENIVWLTPALDTWAEEALQHIDITQKTALLRFRNTDAKIGAAALSALGVQFTFIPRLPITDITSETAWLYLAIAKYLIMDKYSAYDLISEIPAEGNESGKSVSTIKTHLANIQESVKQNYSLPFQTAVIDLANYLGYNAKKEHIKKLYDTISDKQYHNAFDTDQYQNIAVTFHSSKGLEFDQVILFAEDYDLSNSTSIYNHYVAVTRAKHKVIIVKLNNGLADCFEQNLANLFSKSGKKLDNLVTYK